ncbi:hypothetical protein SAMN04488134_1263, partial [Amphibacillus marinus]
SFGVVSMIYGGAAAAKHVRGVATVKPLTALNTPIQAGPIGKPLFGQSGKLNALALWKKIRENIGLSKRARQASNFKGHVKKEQVVLNGGKQAGGSGKIMSSMDAEKHAFNATKGAGNSDSIVLGKFDGGGSTAYTTKAKEFGAQFFELDNWNELSKIYSDKEIWKINEKFLDIQIGAGRDIYLSHNPLDYIGDGSFYSQEIAYLQNHGFTFEKIGVLWRVVR